MSAQYLFLNIGRAGVPATLGTTNGKPNSDTASKVFACARALRRAGFVILNNKVAPSDTELTFCVEVAYDPMRPQGYTGVYGAIRGVADALNQQVIASWEPAFAKGKMLGREFDLDDSWGPFDPALFLMPDGSRLSGQAVAKAA